MWRAIVIFIAVYAGLVLSKRHRPIIAWSGIAIALIAGALHPAEALHGVNWNVLGIFIGSLILAELFIVSRLPETISDILINRSPTLGIAFLSIIMFTSILSSFIENIATVLIVAPIALELSKKTDVSPVPVIIGLAITSNLQGTATLIGDPPSMILAAAKGMNFLDFFWYKGRIGIFFFVQIGAIFGFAVLFLFLKGMRRKPIELPVTPVRSWTPVWLLAAMICLLAIASIVDPGFGWFSGTVCMAIAIVGLIWYHLAMDRGQGAGLARRIDWGTAAFIAAVFVLVSMLEERGAISALVERLGSMGHPRPFVVYAAVVWLSVLVSAFVDNVPYITAVLPVVIGLAGRLGLSEELLAFGVLVGSCLGGNVTPIGASANIVAVGILNRAGNPVSFGSFTRIGLPFTLAATAGAFAALWLVWK
jgi:Na+/H+ antiporter NhaD/arsenite permease-like protein